jgi:hypothetical protein
MYRNKDWNLTMMPPTPFGKNQLVLMRPGKKVMMAAVILVVIVIFCVFAAVVLLQSPPRGGATISHHTTVSQTSRQPAQDSPQKPVDFVIQTGPQVKCGLTCRELTPSITNTGSEKAHNVCITIVLHNSGGDLIPLNGAPSIIQCIGDLTSGESRSEPITINADCGFLASKCLRQTLILHTEATCDETTVQFPDRTIAV